ncbi:MAG: YggS family pyridoxal phosphate-dependent enzyme [Bacteriovoracaceae bacterium]|nr:YggS family pyridoxal phosphate-dependent enzyme [Bacteriovoracaceae bacterium]
MSRPETLARNRAGVLAELKGSKAQLLVVSKTQNLEDIKSLYKAGQRDFGENRVQELEEKAHALRDLQDIRWHMIGHLQSNKLSKLAKIPHLTAIHSIDSLSLLEKVMTTFKDQKVGLFLQVNTSHEDEKSGFENLSEISNACISLTDGKTSSFLQGLMTMATIRTETPEAEARRCFSELRDYREKLQQNLGLKRLELSMGMSGDYLIARDLESDWVRVGSKIFTA